jgi:hypothetical protein
LKLVYICGTIVFQKFLKEVIVKIRETLAAAGTATVLLTGGCSAELSQQDIGCAGYVEEGPMTVQSFAKTIHRCFPNLPEAVQVDGPGRGWTIDIPTRDGGSVFLSTGSTAPRDGDAETFAANADSAFIAVSNPGSEQITTSIALGMKRGPEDAMSMHWESRVPRQQSVTVGLQRGPARAVEANPLYPDEEQSDLTDPALIKCVESAILAEVVQVLKSTNTQNDTPRLAPLPLSGGCGEV